MNNSRRFIRASAPYLSIALLMPVTALAHAPATETDTESEVEKAESVERIEVLGQSRSYQSESPLPVTVLSGEELIHRRQGTLGETLNGMPGIHLDSFGGGVSRPVIRGQTLPRIGILSDGASLFDVSSVSPDHGIITDPLLLDAIEIIRGPAATQYGGNAMNGAINLIDSKIPKAVPGNGVTGAFETRYSTGDNGFSNAARVTMGSGPFAFHIEGSAKDADDYNVPDSFGADELNDSFARSDNFSLGTSWITDQGYVGIAFTSQNAEYGLPGHSHANGACHTHNLDLHCETHGNYTDPFLGSDDSHTARIGLRSERVDVRADYDLLIPVIDHLTFRASYTDYQHDEIDGSITFSQYENEVYDGRLELTHVPLFGFVGTFGAQYTDESFSGLNFNTAHKGYEPDVYNTESKAIFLSEQRAFGDVTIEAAARQDWREIGTPKGVYTDYYIFPPDFELTPEMEELYKGFYDEYFEKNYPTSKHSSLSASLGGTWAMGDGYSTSLTFARSQRAPSVRQLYARGNNLATNSYEVGLVRTASISDELPAATTDVEETTQSVDLTLRKVGGQTEFEVGIYRQDIDDYVFARLIEEENDHRFLVYSSVEAEFTGIDGQIEHHLDGDSSLTLFGDYVRAEISGEDDNLPRIPPSRLGLRYDWAAGPMTANIEYYRTFDQSDIAAYETSTDGYDMVNLTLAYRIQEATEVYIRGTNLTNELAYVHTSFVKDQSPLRGRNVVLGLRYQF